MEISGASLLRIQLEAAYTRTAEDIQMMLAGKLDDAGGNESDLCVVLEE